MGGFLILCRRVFGRGILIVCGVLSVAFFSGNLIIPAIIFGVFALFGLCLSLRKSKTPSLKHVAPSVPTEIRIATPMSASKTGRTYESVRWGSPAPSPKQFGYACKLGIPIVDGMDRMTLSSLLDKAEEKRDRDIPPTKKQLDLAKSIGLPVPPGTSKRTLARLIDERLDQQADAAPADKQQLATIRDYHGVLPRAITSGEADQVIAFLEDHYLPCPFCGIEVCAMDDACCACDRSLKKLRIPIELP